MLERDGKTNVFKNFKNVVKSPIVELPKNDKNYLIKYKNMNKLKCINYCI